MFSSDSLSNPHVGVKASAALPLHATGLTMAPPEDAEAEFAACANSPIQQQRLSLPKGRGCKSGRGLPLQQRKLYRNLARQTPRVQGLTFDHNQIRWISYWKNDQNKQVQKHFPVSRHGFLGARKLALEERNRVMGWPLGKDEAAEAIASLKIDPSVPCFLDGESPMHSEGVGEEGSAEDFPCGLQAPSDTRLTLPSEADDDVSMEQSDAQTEATESGCFPDLNLVALKNRSSLSTGESPPACGLAASFGAKRPAVSVGTLSAVDVSAFERSSCVSLVNRSPSTTTGDALLGADFPMALENPARLKVPDVAGSATCFGKAVVPHPVAGLCEEGALRGAGPGGGGGGVINGSMTEDVSDGFLSRTLTRSTTAADCGGDRRSSLVGRLTSLASCSFEDTEINVAMGETPAAPHPVIVSGEEPMDVGAPPLLSELGDVPLKPSALDRQLSAGVCCSSGEQSGPGADDEEVMDADGLAGEFSSARCAISAFCVTDGSAFCVSRERPSPLSPTSSNLDAGGTLSEEGTQCTRLTSANFASRKIASPSGDSLVGALASSGTEPAPESPTFLRRVYECCDSRKALCAQMVRDLYNSLRAKGQPPCTAEAEAVSLCAWNSLGAVKEEDSQEQQAEATALRAKEKELSGNNNNNINDNNNNNNNNNNSGGDFDGGSAGCWEQVLKHEEAVLLSALDRSSDLCDLSRFVGVFRRCFVDNIKPSELPVEEMRLMAYTLRCLLGPDGLYSLSGASSVVEDSECSSSSVPYPFRDRRGVVHRLLLSPEQRVSPSNASASPLGAINTASALVGILSGGGTNPAAPSTNSSRNAASGGSLFKGPRHAPSSPTAALYAGCFSKATELASRGNAAGVV